VTEDDLQEKVNKLFKLLDIPYVHKPKGLGKKSNHITGLPDIISPRLQIELKSPQLDDPEKGLKEKQRRWKLYSVEESYLLSNNYAEICQKILDTYRDVFTIFQKALLEEEIKGEQQCKVNIVTM
jgi:hypothetical protein